MVFLLFMRMLLFGSAARAAKRCASEALAEKRGVYIPAKKRASLYGFYKYAI
jgi:hypothetical protein